MTPIFEAGEEFAKRLDERDPLARYRDRFALPMRDGRPVLYVNGNRHGPLMEDSQVPGGDILNEYFPLDNNGWLYKNNAWFEFDPAGQSSDGNYSWCTLNKFTTTVNGLPGQHKLARYRWNFWMRQYPDSANNFTNIFAMIDAFNATNVPAYYSNLAALVDTEEFLRMFAIRHATGDMDSVGNQNEWNMYCYQPTRGKWTLLAWDWNITLGSGGASQPADGSMLFNWNQQVQPGVPNGNRPMGFFQGYPACRRAYLRAFQEIAQAAMNNARVDPVLDAKYAAFAANGLAAAPFNVAEPGAAGLKNWIGTMHNSLLRALTNQGVADATFSVGGPTNLVTGTNLLLLTGTAPVQVQTITVNHAPMPVVWLSPKTWQMAVPLVGPTNLLSFQALDRKGDLLTNLAALVQVIVTNAAPATLAPVRINEWMASNNNTLADPADDLPHDWFELFNPNFAIVDLSGYYLTDKLGNKTKWPLPSGTALPPFGFLLVWADGGLGASDHDLHAAFKLSKGGTAIGLFSPAGEPVDTVVFGPQTADVSQGRWPDGSTNIYFLQAPTPKAANRFVKRPAYRQGWL